jgi:hypothetical protein
MNLRRAGVTPFAGDAAVDRQLVGAVVGRGVGGARRQRQPRHRRDRRQRLAAKAHRRQGVEVVDGAQLRRRVTFERQVRFVGRHPEAVIRHRDATEAAALDLDVDAARAGIERILGELLDHRGRPLDHFARCDLIGQLGRQHANSRRRHAPGLARPHFHCVSEFTM